MRVEVVLEPPGEEAEAALCQWASETGLFLKDGGWIEIRPELCLEALADLRARCYDRGLLLNTTFADSKE